MLIVNTIPITLYNKLFAFRDTGKKFELKGDLLKKMTNKNYNVDLAGLPERKFLFGFARKICFDEKTTGNKSTGD